MVDLRGEKREISFLPQSQAPLTAPPNGWGQEKEWEGKPSQQDAIFLGLFLEIRAHLGERQGSGSDQSRLHFPILSSQIPTQPCWEAKRTPPRAFPCLTDTTQQEPLRNREDGPVYSTS